MISTTTDSKIEVDNKNINKSNMPKRKKILLGILRTFIICFLYYILWIILCKVVNQEILIPSPGSVGRSILKLSVTNLFWFSILKSIERILIGFILAIIVGTIMAIVTVKSKFAYAFFYPLISSIKATPVASFIILALLWFTSGDVPVFTCFLMVLPVVWSNITEGIKNVDNNLLEMAYIYNFSIYKKAKYIYIPTIIPFFRAAFVSGLGMGWKAGVAAEVIGRPEYSIGKQLYNAKIYLEMPDMFAWTFVVIIISVLLEKILIWFVNHIGYRYGGLK